MSAINDDLYIEGRALLDRVTPLSTFSDPSTPIGSAYWNLNNYLAVARGDINVGGTPVSQETRNAVLDEAGNIRPAVRNYLGGWITTLKAAFPAPGNYIVPTAGTLPAAAGTLPATTTGAPFLGGILDGEIFGIDKKILAAAALLYFFMGKK